MGSSDMNNNEMMYPQGKLCICSVQVREQGFADYRYIVDSAARDLGFFPVRNPENMGITQNDFESILKNDYPVVVVIIGNEGSNTVKREFDIAKENCLPILGFMKETDGKISDDTEKFMKNLSMVSYDYECAKFRNCEDLYLKVINRLKSYIKDKSSRSPLLQKGVGLAYRANKRLMKKAKSQIIIYQKTSILLLGPRNNNNEQEFYRELMDWLKIERSDDVQFIHVFSWKDTVNEIKNNADDYNLDIAKKNVMDLYEKYEKKNRLPQFDIRYSNIPNSISYVITDTNLVFVIPIEDERYTIELPSNIMKVAEIDKIKDELYQKAPCMKKSDYIKLYKGGSDL